MSDWPAEEARRLAAKIAQATDCAHEPWHMNRGVVAEWIESSLRAAERRGREERERELLDYVKKQIDGAITYTLDATIESLRKWPNGGGQMEILQEAKRIHREGRVEGLREAAIRLSNLSGPETWADGVPMTAPEESAFALGVDDALRLVRALAEEPRKEGGVA